MSITFRVDSPVIGSVIECACGEYRSGLYTDDVAAQEAVNEGATDARCGDDLCNQRQPLILSEHAVDREPPINLSADNGARVLDALGLPSDTWGSADGTDFEGRVLLALALLPADAGIPANTFRAGTLPGPEMDLADGGRRENYLQDRLRQLLRMATTARENGLSVTWC